MNLTSEFSDLETKHLSGGVMLYAAQTNVQIDTEIVKKSGFLAEISVVHQPVIDS